MSDSMSYKNKTIMRSMALLDLFIQHDALTFQEMINLSGIPKTSVYRMINSLEEMGFLEKQEDNTYQLGLVFLKYGQLVASRLDIRKIAYPEMIKIHTETKEAVNLIVKERSEAVYVEKVDHQQKVRLYTAIGRRSPLYAGACSRILLAHMSVEEIETYIQQTTLQPFAKGTITDSDHLRKVLTQTKHDGFTISFSELENHTAEIAAPIFDATGKVIAGLSIAGIEADYTKSKIDELKKQLFIATEIISKNLGYIR